MSDLEQQLTLDIKVHRLRLRALAVQLRHTEHKLLLKGVSAKQLQEACIPDISYVTDTLFDLSRD